MKKNITIIKHCIIFLSIFYLNYKYLNNLINVIECSNVYFIWVLNYIWRFIKNHVSSYWYIITSLLIEASNLEQYTTFSICSKLVFNTECFKVNIMIIFMIKLCIIKDRLTKILCYGSWPNIAKCCFSMQFLIHMIFQHMRF